MDVVHPATTHPLRTPATLAVGGLWVMAALSALKALSTPWVPDADGGTAALLDVLSTLLVVGWIYTAVTFLMWLYRARENLDRRGDTALTWKKGWTIGGWFIPVADLFIPAAVVSEVFARSRPGAFRTWKVPRLVVVWWVAFVLGLIRFTFTTVYADGTRHVTGVQFWNAVNGVAGAVAAVLAVRIVQQVTAWQSGDDWSAGAR
ncbi:DUF4328 domain-containing protein [Rugosimonospora africana]|nr:DUF4328 domain-containing protein [Rugosimonospora africana]